MSTLTARSAPRTILGLLAALGLVAALTMPALAGAPGGPLVDPIFHEETANQTCDDLLGSWKEEDGQYEFKPAGGGVPSNAAYSDGTLSVTISGMTGDSFNWSSNIGVDAVYVKGGNGGSNLYWYDTDGGPGEVTSDNNLVVPNADNNGISHVTFCYDLPDEAEESQAEESQAEESQAEESQAEESQAEASEPAESIREDTQGGNPTPSGGTLPDTAIGQFGQIPATVLSLVLMGALAATVYVRLARQR